MSPGIALRSVGAEGVVGFGIGVTATLVDAAPGPTALTALSPIVYKLPLVSPVTVAGLVVIVGMNAVQSTPPFRVYS